MFTPAGDVLNLPRGSTPIDFAYQVHTEVGHRCIGARVNGDIVTLGHELTTGDRVEILTNRSSHYGPSQDWLNLAVTRSAKQKIRHWFRAQERSEKLESGKRTLERALRRKQLPLKHLTTKGKLEKATMEVLGSDNIDDLYLGLASRRVHARQVVEALAPETAQDREPSRPTHAPPAQERRRRVRRRPRHARQPGEVLQPRPRRRRGGLHHRGRGVSVHRVDCPNVRHLMQSEPERFVSVTWDTPSGEVFPVDFEIVAVDRPGLLKDVLDVISGMNKSASRVTADVQSATQARIHFRVDVRDQGEIEFIKDTVGRIADVTRIYRSKPGLKA